MMINSDNWAAPQNILVILAHPDDPEFFCGATIARWTKSGHHVSYCLLTHGEKGSDNLELSDDDVAKMRVDEQNNAAKVLGVEKVRFLDYSDGYLESHLKIRKEVVRVIREEKPDIIVTSDPTNYYPHEGYINHADHRIAGQIVIDAVFPAAGNARFFPDLIKDGFQPHHVKEIWLSLTANSNIVLDVTEYWQNKINALYEHKSQIGDQNQFTKRMMKRKTPESTEAKPRFEEAFRRFIFT